MGGLSKLYRFWKLRTKNFMAVNNETQQYIVEHTVMSIKTSPNSFKSFYCNTVFGSNTFNNVTNMCEVTQEMCTANAATAENYKQRFREDFGDYYSTLGLESMLEKCGKSSSYIPTVPSSQSIQTTDTQTKTYPSQDFIQWGGGGGGGASPTQK